jgi:hypothetical protein
LFGVVQAHTSYLSIRMLCAHSQLGSPCVETIRGWVLRVGLYLLHHLPQRRADWVWVVDHTMQWGTSRCLVVLGVTQEQLQTRGFRLCHTDVVVLALEVIEHSDGLVVRRQLTALSKRLGIPRQIVSDHGSDLTKGIRLFREEHAEVLDTYDVTHKMACLLKRLLEADARWPEFIRQCAAVGARLRQTAGSFLLPPTLRTKARYMNLDTILAWAERMQALHSPEAGMRLAPVLGLSVSEAQAWWTERFAWLAEFQADLQTWGACWQLVQRAEEQIRAEGLRADSAEHFRSGLSACWSEDERVPRMAEQIESFLADEGRAVPAGQAVLGSSEVIESVFGRYKQYVERGVWSEIGSNVLLLPLLVVTLTTSLLGRALTAVPLRAVWAWCAEHLSASRQKRFGTVFGRGQAPASSEPPPSGAGEPQQVGPANGRPPSVDPESLHAGAASGRPPPTGTIAA